MEKRTVRRAAAAALGAAVALTAGAGTAQAAGANLDRGHTTTAYLVPWDTSSYSNALAQAANLTDASLFAYKISSTGALSLSQGGAVDCSAMRKLQQAGVRVQALVSNLDSSGWNQAAAQSVINNSSRRSTFVTNAVNKAVNPGCSNGFKFDGLELDFENLRYSDRAGFTATVKALASALRAKGKTLHVSVFSKSTDNPSGYPTQQAQDWVAIGKVADSVRIQGYGYCWEGGGCVGGPAPGPIDPSFWDQATLKYAVTAMPAAKVTLGIPLYGIDWVRGANGTAVVWNDVVRLINANGGAPVWNETNASGQLVQYPSYSYGSGHVISFNNQYATAARLALARSAGIGGIAFWRLGGEDPGTWTQVAANW